MFQFSESESEQDDEKLFWDNLPSTQELLKSAIKPKPAKVIVPPAKVPRAIGPAKVIVPRARVICANKSPRVPRTSKSKRVPRTSKSPIVPRTNKSPNKWIKCSEEYHMSNELFKYFFDEKTKTIDVNKFLYRKDSIAIEIDKIFPGCVIYIRRPPYQGQQWYVLRAYCAHLNCRQYKLKATYGNPTSFSIEYNKPRQVHTCKLARQVRRYERDEKEKKLEIAFPTAERQNDIVKANDDTVNKGNFDGVTSLPVYKQIRREVLSEQDNCNNDIEDVAAMKTDDPKTNFISDILPTHKYGVYLHAKNQHDFLNKLHKIRDQTGNKIFVRLDASGDIARDVNDEKLLYHALAVNVSIDNDKTTTAVPLTEQFNTHNTTKDISKWLFDFKLSHTQWYENHKLLFDFLLSDFSFANFHAVLNVFNNISLANFLNATYSWISTFLATGKFPDEYHKLVKLLMCYTHLMATFADMCRRLFGKTSNSKQLPQSKIILEILSSFIKAKDYPVLLQLWKQLVALLNNEFINDDVRDALATIKKITTEINLDDFADDKLTNIVDIDDLPEKDDTLYKNNLYYIQFSSYTKQTYCDNNEKADKEKNVYYCPAFLDKFLKRFVPLIPLWTNVMLKEEVVLPNIESINPISTMQAVLKLDHPPPHSDLEIEIEEISEPDTLINVDLHILEVLHNQPLETYFGKFKRELYQNAVHLGQPPIKLGRAITFSRASIDNNIKSLNLGMKKSQCNSQRPRKKYEKKKNQKPTSVDENTADIESSSGNALEKSLDENLQIENMADIENSSGNVLEKSVVENLQIEKVPNPACDKLSAASNLSDLQNLAHSPGGVRMKLRTQNPATKLSAGDKLSERKDEQLDTKTFKEAKENYDKKRKMRKYSYFQGKGLAKINTENSSNLYDNSLFKNISLYYNITNSFAIAANANSCLSNHDFEILHLKKDLSPELMKYLTSSYPDNVHVLILPNKDVEKIKLIQDTVFVLIHVNTWVLFVIDKVKKSFYELNPMQRCNTEAEFREIFAKLKLPKSFKEKSLLIHQEKNEIYNTGIYVYDYMMQYITTGKISTNRIYGNAVRNDLESEVIKKSKNMVDSCLICGSEDDHPLGFGWVKCTKCVRWMHSYCIDRSMEEAELDDNLKCCICSNCELPQPSQAAK